MSFAALAWAFDFKKGITSQQKLMLLVLSQFAGEGDLVMIRSAKWLAEHCGMDSRVARSTLLRLERLGLIKVDRRDVREERYPIICQVLVGSELP